MSTALQPAPSPGLTATTPTQLEAILSVPSTIVDRLYRLTVDQYQAMAEAGILDEGDRVVLLKGLLVAKMTKHQPHIIATDLAQSALIRILPTGWYVSMQNPITLLDSSSVPEPDIQIVRGGPRDYKNRRVTSGDVALVIEVADSSVREDQTTMKAIYAAAAIPIYWILNLPANRLEVYSDPTGPDPNPDYRRRSDHGLDDSVPLMLEGQEVARLAVRDLLP